MEFKRQSKLNMAKRVVDEPPVVDIYEKATNSRVIPNERTGLVVNNKFTEHACPWSDHLEKPERYTCILERIKEYGLLERCKLVECLELTKEQALTKHDAEHIDLLKHISEMDTIEEAERKASNYDSIYFNKHTYSSAVLAAGSCINLTEEILRGNLQNGMAIVRPPGHHAMKSAFCGFCYLNNVALSAQHAIDKHKLKKILIVDWDVHHGQATQQMFYEDQRVLYFSIHRYENGLFWPCLRESNFDYIGKGEGAGFNINVPLNELGCTDADYFFIFNNLLMPIAYEFQPELILVSAGYDAAIGCPEGQMKVSPACYAQMTNQLMALARGRVAIFLEGGYFLPSLSESAALTLGALLGDVPPPVSPLQRVKDSVRISVLSCIFFLRSFWKCLGHFDVFPNECAVDFDKLPTHHVLVEFTPGEDFVLEPPFPTRDYSVMNTPEENAHYIAEMEKIKIGEEKYRSNMLNKVGYCFDLFMLEHYCIEGYSPERPQRLITAKKILSDFDLFDRMHYIEGESLTFEDLLKVHDKGYIQKLRDLKEDTESGLNMDHKWINVYSSLDTSKVALFAAGCVKKLVDEVLDGRLSSAVAIVRPPGHHAETDCAGGFCFVNNIAVAARHAIDSKKAQRVMILDWDVHHGNGTQDIFFNQREVLYMSLHRYDHGDFYPNTTRSNFNKMGTQDGHGYNINVAWNDQKMDNTDYISAFFRIVLPVAYEYRPDLLLISAGFDAAVGDPLGGYNLTPEVFGHFVQLLKSTCGGKIVLALEGGYNCNTVGYCLAMCCKALLGDPMPIIDSIKRCKDAALLAIADTITVHIGHWPSLLPYVQLLSQENH